MFLVSKSFIVDLRKWQKPFAKSSTKTPTSAEKGKFIFGQIKFQRRQF